MGKGRDMGFVSINGFEIKISGGNGEVCVSRDLYRVATRFDFFRMLSVYYSGPGFFINNAILMTTVYLQTWVLVVLALAGAYLISSGTLREAEGIGLLDDDAEETPGEEPAPDESSAENRRLLMDANRQILQTYGYAADTVDEEPEDKPEDEPVDAAAELAAGNEEDAAADIYASFLDPASLEDTGGGNPSYDVPSFEYVDDGYAEAYGDPDDEPAPTATSSGQQSSGSAPAGIVRQAAVHIHSEEKHMNSIVSM